MHAWPDAPAVSQFLARAARRLTWLAMLRGASIGLAAAALLVVVGWLRSWAPGATVLMAVGLVVAAVAVAILRSGRAMNAVAGRVERRAPACRNLIVTAAEIVARPDGVRAYIGARVCRDAAATIARLDLASLFPAGRTAAVFVVALTLASAATLALVARAPVPAVLDLPGLRPGGVLHQVAITITPPPYTGRPTERLADPDTVTVLAGSRIDVVVHGRAREASLESRDSRAILARNADGTFAGAITADADGFLAIDVRGDTPADAARRLIGVRVTTDARPAVRIVTPGKDLLVPDTARTIALSIAATDDLGLAALGLRYTRVTGSGENFTFTDDELPVVITREDERTWRATASLPLAPLALEPGDMIVYRAIARDHRPGAAAAESDAFIIELVAPGHVASEGFAIDD